MASVHELIGQWRDKKINGTALMRGLATWADWQVRMNEDSTITISTTPDGKRNLLAFSSPEAYSTFAQANSSATVYQFIKLPGRRLFGGPLEDVDRIYVDPLSPYDVFYDKELFDQFREIANAVLVEEVLTALRHGDPPQGAFQIVRDYKHYYLPSVVTDGKPAFLMAPDDKGRKLAAAFTSDDTFDAFLTEAREISSGAEVQQLQIDGSALFDTLRQMQIDGFVFNCSGPVTPIAFAQAAAGLFLES